LAKKKVSTPYRKRAQTKQTLREESKGPLTPFKKYNVKAKQKKKGNRLGDWCFGVFEKKPGAQGKDGFGRVNKTIARSTREESGVQGVVRNPPPPGERCKGKTRLTAKERHQKGTLRALRRRRPVRGKKIWVKKKAQGSKRSQKQQVIEGLSIGRIAGIKKNGANEKDRGQRPGSEKTN